MFLVSCFLDVGDSPACLDPDALLVVGGCTPEAIRTRRQNSRTDTDPLVGDLQSLYRGSF
jgi:hypothetical protein